MKEVYGIQGGGIGEFVNGLLRFVEAPEGFEPGDLVPKDWGITGPFDYDRGLQQINSSEETGE
jgi:hypothetical protein